jgi:hypothetical protein
MLSTRRDCQRASRPSWIKTALGTEMRGAITISTLGDLQDRGYKYHATCPKCNKTRKVDLDTLVARYGRATSYIRPQSPIRVKCKDCGTLTDSGIIIPY